MNLRSTYQMEDTDKRKPNNNNPFHRKTAMCTIRYAWNQNKLITILSVSTRHIFVAVKSIRSEWTINDNVLNYSDVVYVSKIEFIHKVIELTLIKNWIFLWMTYFRYSWFFTKQSLNSRMQHRQSPLSKAKSVLISVDIMLKLVWVDF